MIQDNKLLQQRIQSLESKLGLKYVPRSEGAEYDDSEHIADEYGFFRVIKALVRMMKGSEHLTDTQKEELERHYF